MLKAYHREQKLAGVLFQFPANLECGRQQESTGPWNYEIRPDAVMILAFYTIILHICHRRNFRWDARPRPLQAIEFYAGSQAGGVFSRYRGVPRLC